MFPTLARIISYLFPGFATSLSCPPSILICLSSFVLFSVIKETCLVTLPISLICYFDFRGHMLSSLFELLLWFNQIKGRCNVTSLIFNKFWRNGSSPQQALGIKLARHFVFGFYQASTICSPGYQAAVVGLQKTKKILDGERGLLL